MLKCLLDSTGFEKSRDHIMETDIDSDSMKAETYHVSWCGFQVIFFSITAVNNAGVVTQLQLFSIPTSAYHPITTDMLLL